VQKFTINLKYCTIKEEFPSQKETLLCTDRVKGLAIKDNHVQGIKNT
jgi:hypothetical protein